MKRILLIMLCASVIVSCEKTLDVPSLAEKMDGRWNVAGYTEERYQPALNTVTRIDFAGRVNDNMVFSTFDHLYVNFDTAATAVWTYKEVDPITIDIEGKKWRIIKLDKTEFDLSLNERDTAVKLRNIVYYRLRRP